MNKMYQKLFYLLGFFVLVACGDDASSVDAVENKKIGDLEIVETVDDLPECKDENNGAQYLVKEDSRKRICVDGTWYASIATSMADGLDCHTEELKKGGGLKVVCNGDSVGVVKNGKNGSSGKDGDSGAVGKPCTIDVNEDIVSVICSDDTLKYIMGKETEEDVVSQLKLSGYSQKGPFVKGSKVFAYELNNSRDLEQTSRSFVGTIQSNDGAFVIPGVSLVSPCVLLEASGFYYREVTGKVSVAPISLFALTDLMERETANINLLTHIQYYRTKNLVLAANLDVYQARDSSKKEILKTFHIELEKISDLEDLNIFEKGDDNAALLAISIMLQRDSSDAVLTELLSEISVDISEYGAWKDSLKRAEVALWSAKADLSGKFSEFRNNMANWSEEKNIPDFEKYIRSFWTKELGFAKCGVDVPNATGKNIFENRPEKAVATYLRYFNEDDRFVCDASVEGNPRWRYATDIEKDTMGWGRDFQEGDIRMGQVYTDRIFVFDENRWRLGTARDTSFADGYFACVKSRLGKIAFATDSKYYKCEDYLSGDTTRFWVPATDYDVDTTLAAKECTSENANDTLVGIVDPSVVYLCEDETWLRTTSEYDYTKGLGICTKSRNGEYARGTDDDIYACYYNGSEGRWYLPREISVSSGLPEELFFNPYIEYDTIIDSRDNQVYRVVTIGSQTWMAENLNFGGFKSYYDVSWCVGNCSPEQPGGRYYAWSAVMDSIGQYSDSSKGCGSYTTCEVKTPARGICPENWHIPSIEEWQTLVETVESLGGGSSDLVSWAGWNTKTTDEYGFSAVPTGYREGIVTYILNRTIFWSSTENDADAVETFHLGSGGSWTASWDKQEKGYASAIVARCVKDAPAVEPEAGN